MTDTEHDHRFTLWINRVMSVLKILAFCVFIVGVPTSVWLIGRLTPSPMGFQEPTHGELISTLFTGAALMLGALAVIVAALAIWGYVAIKKEAAQIATASTRKEMERFMKKASTRKEMHDIIQKLAAPILQELQVAVQMPSAYADGKLEDKTRKTVGESYPKNKEA